MKTSEINTRVLDRLTMNNCVPMKSKPLCALLNISDRQLQRAVYELRMMGQPICSGNDGYWLYNGIDDSLAHTIAIIESHAMKSHMVARAMKNRPIEGQQEW